MTSAGHLSDLYTTEDPLFGQNFNDICVVCLKLHENDRTSNVRDMLPVENNVEVYKLLESISLFKYSKRTPQLLCSTCLFKLVSFYEFQQMCNNSFIYLNNYTKKKDAEDSCKIQVDDVELHDLYNSNEDIAIADAISNEREEFNGEVCDNNFREENIENAQTHVIAAESPKPVDLESTATKSLEATTDVFPQANIVSTDSIERDISTNESIGNLGSLNPIEELTSIQSSNPDTCAKKDFELDRQIQNLPSTGTNKDKRHKYVCHYCNKVFKLRISLKYHIDMHEDVRNFVCTFCGRQFRTDGGLTIHERRHTGEKPYKCDFCEKRYISKSELTSHTERHHRPDQSYSCKVCERKFKVKSDIRLHMALHADERPFKCKLCGKGYNQTGALKNHMYNHGNVDDKDTPVSGEEKKYKCTQCEASFSRSRYLGRHRREVHAEPRYACELCDCKYKDAKALKHHMMKHSGIRPYVCTYCNKDFARKYSLTVHLRTHEMIPKHC